MKLEPTMGLEWLLATTLDGGVTGWRGDNHTARTAVGISTCGALEASHTGRKIVEDLVCQIARFEL